MSSGPEVQYADRNDMQRIFSAVVKNSIFTWGKYEERSAGAAPTCRRVSKRQGSEACFLTAASWELLFASGTRECDELMMKVFGMVSVNIVRCLKHARGERSRGIFFLRFSERNETRCVVILSYLPINLSARTR